MSFLENMQQRYTTKKYDKTKKINPTTISELKEIVRLSPSSINSQPWQFSFISDQETRNKLSEFSWHNKNIVRDCDTVVVFSRYENIELFEKHIETNLSPGAVGYYKEFLKPLPAHELKAWFNKQLYLSLGVFLSACANMDIDSTPMEGIEPENYDAILNQTDYHAEVAVCIGYRDQEDFNQIQLKPKSRIDLNHVVKSI